MFRSQDDIGISLKSAASPAFSLLSTPAESTSCALFKSPLFREFIFRQLFLTYDIPQIIGNDDLAKKMAIELEIVKSNPTSGKGYSHGSIITNIKLVKKSFIQSLTECSQTSHLQIETANHGQKSALKELMAPISNPNGRAELKKYTDRMTLKLSAGTSAGLFFSEDQVATDTTKQLLERIGISIPELTDIEFKRATNVAKRFNKLLRFGRQKLVFDPDQNPLPDLSELKNRVNPGVKPGCSPLAICKAHPDLSLFVEQSLGSRRPTVIAPVIATILDQDLPIATKRNFRAIAVRRELYQQLLDENGQLSITGIDFQTAPWTRSLAKYYGSKSARSSGSRDALIALIDECHPGGCPDLLRFQIYAKEDLNGKYTLALRFFTPGQSSEYYRQLLSYAKLSETYSFLSDLRNSLMDLASTLSVVEFSDRFGVGRRGALKLKNIMSSQGDNFRLYKKGSKNASNGTHPMDADHRPEMQNCQDLMRNLSILPIIRALSGSDSVGLKRKVELSTPELTKLQRQMQKIREAVNNHQDENIVTVGAEILESVKSIESNPDAHIITLNRHGNIGALRYLITPTTFRSIKELVAQIISEAQLGLSTD